MSCAHQNLPRRADAASTTSAVAISVDFDRISNKVLSFIKEGGRSGRVGLYCVEVTPPLFPESVQAHWNAKAHEDALLNSL